MSNFGKNLKALRIERTLTQDQLAERLEVSKSRISMYENGNREPSFEMLETIADFFNVDMCTLIDAPGNVGMSVTEDETTLLKQYRKLDDIGQAMAFGYVDGLVKSGDHVRDSQEQAG